MIEVKHCEDTRPGHQLEAPSYQHKLEWISSGSPLASLFPLVTLKASESPFF